MATEAAILFDIGIIIIAAAVFGFLAKIFRQPLIGAYILSGIVIGPEVLGLVQSTGVIQMFAKLGVAFLLFIVGLELDLSRLQEVRNTVIGAALAEVLMMFALGFFAMYVLGITGMAAIYAGLFVAFSSTAVLVKILSDRDDIDTLHGRIILGVLLIQDVIVVMALSVLSTLNPPHIDLSMTVSALSTGAGLFALAIVLSKYIIPHLFKLLQDSHEMIFVTALAVMFGFVGLSAESGLSEAVGGFLAGIALTAFPYNVEIGERAEPMRDFFVIILFVSLGMLINLDSLYSMLPHLLVLLGLVLVVKPFILHLMVSLFGYGERTAFYTGTGLGQVSEFSVVLALLGLEMGHIGDGMFSLITALLIITITTTSYTLKYQRWLYEHVEEFVIGFEGAQYEEDQSETEDHIVLCGAHIKGRKILRYFEEHDDDTVVIDYDPDVIEAARERDVHPIYGDIEDAHTLDRANVQNARAVISTVPEEESNRYLVNYTRRHNEDAVIIVSANDIESALLLYEEGADYVLYPKMLAAREAADIVQRLYGDGEPLEEARNDHIEELEHELEEKILRRHEPEFVKVLKRRMQDIGKQP